MQFYSFGINYHQASVELRDSFAFTERTRRALYKTISVSEGAEYILLSTCNRLECYLYGSEDDILSIQRAIAEAALNSWPSGNAFLYKDERAVMHVLEVAGGLDSMVLGDAQILGQIKEAYRVAVEQEAVNSVLHRLMHTAFGAAKRILTETSIAAGSSSVAGTAASVAIKHLQAVQSQRILVLGAGEMGRLVVDALNRIPCLQITVANRSEGRLQALQEEYAGIMTQNWESRYRAMQDAEVIIVTTAAQQVVLEQDAILQIEDQQERLIIDICMPRNVDPNIDALPGYTVCNLDTLQQEIDQVIVLRQADLPPARAICEEVLADFVSWVFHHQAMQPAIHAIHQTFETIRRQEVERNYHRFSHADIQALDRLTRSIMQKVLAVPVVRLKNVGPDHIDYVNGIKVLKTLFAKEACEEDITSDYDLSKSIMDVLACAESEDGLAGLATCPFHENKATNTPKSKKQAIESGHSRVLTLGTRKSALAMWQAHHVQRLLQAAGFSIELERITTRGDRILDRPFAQIDGKALFTKELDLALLDGRIDLAVHSLKDLPTVLPQGLVLAAISKRANPLDAFVAHPSYSGSLAELPEGATIGTSSLRRTAQLKAWRPDLNIVPIRGNVDTRIKKLDESNWQGIVLAAAGLTRLGLENRIHEYFDTEQMLPAPGQGALGIVCAESNTFLREQLLDCLHCPDSAVAVRSERALLQALDGGCHVPVGGYTVKEPEGYVLYGFVGTLDGQKVIKESIAVNPGAPEVAGIELAQYMLDQGALDILNKEKEQHKSTS